MRRNPPMGGKAFEHGMGPRPGIDYVYFARRQSRQGRGPGAWYDGVQIIQEVLGLSRKTGRWIVRHSNSAGHGPWKESERTFEVEWKEPYSWVAKAPVTDLSDVRPIPRDNPAHRPNPPVSRAPRAIARVAKRAHVHGKPHGCGKFGCVYPTNRTGTVLKVTTDPAEVRMVREVRRLRGKVPASLSGTARRELERVGLTPEAGALLPGIVDFKGDPVRVKGTHAGWCYLREDVKPLDAEKGERAAREIHRIDMAIEDFWYSSRRPDPARFLLRFPELRLIVQTMVFLEAAHHLRLEDVHVEQTAVVKTSSVLHKAGDLVLYDGQLD